MALLCDNSASVAQRSFSLSCLRHETKTSSLRVPTRPRGDARTRNTEGGRQLLGWGGLRTLSAQFFVTGAGPFCTVGFPAGVAGWARDHRTGNGQTQHATGETEVGMGWLLSLVHLHFGWLLLVR